jgi:hypothetical protein
MIKGRALRLALALMGAIATVAVTPTAAFAAPTNDDYASAMPITSLPFTTTLDTSTATWDPTDPQGCSSNGSVWFTFTAATNMTVMADTAGSDYYPTLSAWTGNQGSLNQVACNEYNGQVAFSATAGTTYHFMAAYCCGSGGSGGGNLHFSMTQVTPPTNDNFADAATVNGLPFTAQPDLTAATRETGEPTSCLGAMNTAWYSFTPTTTQSISATVDGYAAGVAAYTGSSVTSLTQLGCTNYLYYPLTFRAEAGRTYLFQVGQWAAYSGSVTFHLDVAPNPVARFYYQPGDPSSFDTIQFHDYSSDPGNVGISSETWDFGDGATAVGYGPSHRYAADGDYTVLLAVTTADGRSASVSNVVSVRTHDVSIDRLAVPTTAHAGQTVKISVDVRNSRYPETVRVDLNKSVPGGFSSVGSLTQLVDVKTGGQFTRYLFSYTITADDVAAGKVTFQAVATIAGYRDAFPADNQLLSPPVNVN